MPTQPRIVGRPQQPYVAISGQVTMQTVGAVADGQRWGCRLEIYHTDPAEEPDMRKWETELAFRLAG